MLGVLDVLAGAAFAVLGVVAVRDSWRYAAVCAGAALAEFTEGTIGKYAVDIG